MWLQGTGPLQPTTTVATAVLPHCHCSLQLSFFLSRLSPIFFLPSLEPFLPCALYPSSHAFLPPLLFPSAFLSVCLHHSSLPPSAGWTLRTGSWASGRIQTAAS